VGACARSRSPRSSTPIGFASIRRVLGRIAIVDLSFGDQYGSGTRTDVCDLRGGGCYPVAYRMVVMFSATLGPSATEVLVTKAGRAVVALTAPDGAITIAAFGLPGRRIDLDRGPAASVPASSLRLTGNLASWTHDGQPRSAESQFSRLMPSEDERSRQSTDLAHRGVVNKQAQLTSFRG